MMNARHWLCAVSFSSIPWFYSIFGHIYRLIGVPKKKAKYKIFRISGGKFLALNLAMFFLFTHSRHLCLILFFLIIFGHNYELVSSRMNKS